MRGCGKTNGLGRQNLPEAVLFRIPSSPHPLIPANHVGPPLSA